ncbi:MAG TPA: peptidoglycan DD-metalloendopeptidase family protein [Ruminiclostridium sp.]|nr:peptidoglycan DD-metalloendopeptidase family protein [Ruminiclostridium sp.]
MRSEKKRKIIAITAIVVAALMIVGVLAPVLMSNAASSSGSSYDQQYAQLQQKQKELEQKKNSNSGAINQNNSTEAAIQSEIDSIQANMDIVKQQMDILGDKIEDCNTKIAKANTDIADAQKRIDKNTELYRQRICALYEVGGVSRLQVMLSSQSITDFLTRYEIIKKISEHDNDLIAQLKKDKASIEADKKLIEEQKSSLEKSQSELQSKKSEYDSQAAQRQASISKLKDQNAELQRENDQIDKQEADASQKLAQMILQRQKQTEKNNQPIVGGDWIWPVQGTSTYISSPFGPRPNHVYPHTGIDIAGSNIAGKPIVASKAGTVIIAGFDNSGIYGNYVVIDHGGGYTSLYGHCSRLAVSNNETVKQGQVIGYVGNTGNVVSLGGGGYHLHFQIMENGTPVNPLGYVAQP